MKATNICFLNLLDMQDASDAVVKIDETQFDTTDREELKDLWWDFCWEVGILTGYEEVEVDDPEEDGKLIRAIVKQAGEPPKVTMIDDSLETLQNLVGGYIQCVGVTNAVVTCNEEGRLMGLPRNCSVEGISFCGTIVITGETEDGDFTDVPDAWIDAFGI